MTKGIFGIMSYFGESKINHRPFPSRRIEKKVRRLQITVDDSTSVDIAQCPEHATKVLSDSFNGQCFVVLL